MATKQEVIINLFKSNLPGAIDNSSFVQQLLKTQLIEDIKIVSKQDDDDDLTNGIINEAGRQVFFIDGTRGAGKTTFMNEIVSYFKKKDKDIHTLRCIDPTKLPQIEPILVTIIAQLNADVSKKIKESSGWSSEQNQDKESWKLCLNNISRALQLLDKKEYSKDFFDEALELNNLLTNASDGLGLEEQLSKLLKQACNILGCKAILVAFDDIDTQFNTGWSVLEAIRKYFNSPKLIVLMTGDLRLYSQLIRGKQYGNYDNVMLTEEADDKEKQKRSIMVNHLEQQYLIKLLPVHRRINLKSLYQLIDDKRPIHVITSSKNVNKASLGDAINEMLKSGLHLRQSADLKLYADEILKQPIRLVIQLLQRYYQQKEANSEMPPTDIFNEAIRSTMLGSIYKAGLTYDNSDAHIGVITKDIFTYTLIDGDSNTGFYLRPQSESEILRSSAIYLASMVSKATEGSLWKTLHLMLAGCGSVTLYDKLLQVNSQKLPKEQIEQACRTYFGLGRNESLMHWANRSNAALCPVNQDGVRGVHPGLLRLNRSHPKSNPKKDGSPQPYKSSEESSPLARLAVDIASSDLSGRNMHSFLSILNLLGGISDLIEGFESTNENDDKLKALLAKLAFRTTCSAPPWASFEQFVTDDWNVAPDHSQTPAEDNDSKIISIIKTWLKLVTKVERDIKVNSILIGKIWTRLYFNLTNIAEVHGSKIGNNAQAESNAAKIMRFNVIALLHAVLFEEDAYHTEPLFTGINERKNPVTSINLFIDKLDKIKTYCDTKEITIENRLPIFYLLLTCPLLHPFLFAEGAIGKNKENDFKNIINQIVSKEYENYRITDSQEDEFEHRLTFLKDASITATIRNN
ncbi:archaeal ATPase [Xenorhabdus sp. Vera]|uniref:archaeal ATPase n=1 Tax=Xenorhabdus koppenhoeferi TaxID=351659 RepID=UPI0019AD12C6|nr:archaeal ATPase [Xenorhabdus sp. Vera]MBD2811443.1 archaeal ATPase [Xenorhabdus sp. Vera]